MGAPLNGSGESGAIKGTDVNSIAHVLNTTEGLVIIYGKGRENESIVALAHRLNTTHLLHHFSDVEIKKGEYTLKVSAPANLTFFLQGDYGSITGGSEISIFVPRYQLERNITRVYVKDIQVEYLP